MPYNSYSPVVSTACVYVMKACSAFGCRMHVQHAVFLPWCVRRVGGSMLAPQSNQVDAHNVLETREPGTTPFYWYIEQDDM